ncbi:MAG: [FeFe] hydrogenase, group A [Firmicutes bacterium]|nr:[FeFe] hydrogenase, group A [Bacillota bacterium]MCL1953898.1 [FeFe] hydrogenase, group A [Bacillota bacterium]
MKNMSMIEIMKYNPIEDIKKAVADPNKIVIMSTAPAVRVALGEMFGKPAGHFVEGKMVAALRKLGADYVFDINFGADMTIMEESAELVDRIKNGTGKLPQFTSCCPGWVNFVEKSFPEIIPHLSTAKSPIGMHGPTIKTYFAKENNIDPNNIVNVVLTPCTIKKFEINREEMNAAGIEYGNPEMRDMDYCITTVELGNWLKEEKISFDDMQDSNFDDFMGSGAGAIFGKTGGVMEAAIRTAYYIVNGKNPDPDFVKATPVRGFDGIREATIDLGGTEVRVAVVHGLANAKAIVEQTLSGNCPYHFVEIMTCKGGCISGPGQPPTDDDGRKARIAALQNKDDNMTIRHCHENPSIKEVYDKKYKEPLSHEAHKVLHTKYGNYPKK